MGLVCCHLDRPCLYIVVDNVLRGSCKAKENPMVDMGVTLRRAIVRDLHCNRRSECPYVFHVRNTATPSFIRGHFDLFVVYTIIQVTSTLNRVAPELGAQRAAV